MKTNTPDQKPPARVPGSLRIALKEAQGGAESLTTRNRGNHTTKIPGSSREFSVINSPCQAARQGILVLRASRFTLCEHALRLFRHVTGGRKHKTRTQNSTFLARYQAEQLRGQSCQVVTSEDRKRRVRDYPCRSFDRLCLLEQQHGTLTVLCWHGYALKERASRP